MKVDGVVVCEFDSILQVGSFCGRFTCGDVVWEIVFWFTLYSW